MRPWQYHWSVLSLVVIDVVGCGDASPSSHDVANPSGGVPSALDAHRGGSTPSAGAGPFVGGGVMTPAGGGVVSAEGSSSARGGAALASSGGASDASSLGGASSVLLGGSATGGVYVTGGAPWDGSGAGNAVSGSSASGGAGVTRGGSTATIGGNGTGSAATIGGAAAIGGTTASSVSLPPQSDVLRVVRKANDYFTKKWPDPVSNINPTHKSNLWTRAVYFEGLMGLLDIEPDATRKKALHDYAVRWGDGHGWKLYGGSTSDPNADNQCCGQTYIDLYAMDQPAQRNRIAAIQANMAWVAGRTTDGDWTWIDAIQMGMPVFAKLGALDSGSRYWSKMHSMYAYAKTTRGFYNQADHLWWRDATFKTKKTSNGKPIYWSRGNGWVFAALTRVLDTISANEAHRAEYVSDFTAMASALVAVQRSDGFWNVNLADPKDYGGPESSGTALFTYGLAWGTRLGVLDAAVYGAAITKGWNALASAVHADGFLGYVQGTGSQPSDGQPVTFDSVPDYDDFGVGAFLLAGSEVYQLASP